MNIGMEKIYSPKLFILQVQRIGLTYLCKFTLVCTTSTVLDTQWLPDKHLLNK